jgi:toxin YoeB
MGKYSVKIEKLAQDHLNRHLKAGDKSSIKKIEKIFVELSETPYLGIGNPEPL